MNLFAPRRCILALLLVSALSLFSVQAFSAELPTGTDEISLDTIPSEEVESILGKLSEEQVRSLLAAEMQRKTAEQSPGEASRTDFIGYVGKWLHLIDRKDSGATESQQAGQISFFATARAGFGKTLQQFSKNSTGSSPALSVLIMLVVFLLGFAAEKIFKVTTRHFHDQLLVQNVPEYSGLNRFWVGILHTLPALTSLLVFTCSSILLFLVFPISSHQPFRLLFMAILFVILFSRIVALLCRFFLSPKQPSLRLFNMNDTAAGKLQRFLQISLSFVVAAYSVIAFFRETGAGDAAVILLSFILATLFLMLLAFFVLRNKQIIAEKILSSENNTGGNGWLTRQFASLWHLFALLYLIIVWLNFLYVVISGKVPEKGALLLSLLAVPIFLMFDRIGQWAVRNSIRTLRIYDLAEDPERPSDPDIPSPEEKERLLAVRVGRLIRFALFCAVTIWVLSRWNYHLPYAAAIARAVFESLVTVALALLFWRFASGYIERKINESTPDVAQKDEGAEDEEWGGGVEKGRGYTLLPMARKFIGTVLTVMVVLIILSSIGVNIGPLLAGAGVIGLAVGFGAQKLVSDVLSGFFYLLDDAFRIGEYLQAGNVSGRVENITLRNVILRHHRGMLQIVPYSELGSITNFMRGGIVEKFSLEFPYGTDIDLVRRIIKKVGKQMQEEEEFKDDILNPVKSQGVNLIANSVIVIRVKFTTKPGAQFVVRREAYRRITEALEAKGLFYAHRKVIVELPENKGTTAIDQKKLAEAGAAAGLAAMADDEKKAAEEARK